ncbi:cyclase family protein [Rhodocytophaga rosea]|uniref:Cyclase family protein n=1 Tax=Rhodocytophaga rosea TaxID=2704465 RepID=A0A6C0GLQ1_9BACT|nr:cyclase family protein [Rhodocytophaga rosea]QHT69011.1 cyclase family protein [Rhodocytophaga rosea]
MIFTFSHLETQYSFDISKPIDISLPLRNGNNNPSCYYADPVEFETIRAGNFIGSVAEGGPVNHKKVFVTPHGNGTHTECFGHISADPAGTINKCLTHFFFIALLVSISPHTVINGDQVITLTSFQQKAASFATEAVIIRTLPNDTSKRQRQYSGANPPYLEPALCDFFAQHHVKHLIVDVPSVDKEIDGGLLAAHKAFWQFPEKIRTDSTITELAFVPDIIADGIYLLNLQICSFELDVSPSKPILYPLQKLI